MSDWWPTKGDRIIVAAASISATQSPWSVPRGHRGTITNILRTHDDNSYGCSYGQEFAIVEWDDGLVSHLDTLTVLQEVRIRPLTLLERLAEEAEID